jgi:hypothetical protein
LVVRQNHERYKALIKGSFDLDQENLNKLHDNELREDIKELFKAASESFKKVVKKFETDVAELRDEHTLSLDEVFDDDPVLEALEAILNEPNMGSKPAPEVLEERRSDALDRLERGVPPGFEDRDKADPTGDYLIWSELLEHAESSGRPLLFVTNDKKEDWYRAPISGR